MIQKVDPNKLLELSGRMKQLNSRMEVQTLGMVQDIMRMVEQTRREYPETYVQAAARQVEFQLQEIRKIAVALDGRQKKMIWNLQQAAGQYQQLEKELAQQFKKNVPRVPDKLTSKYAKDIQAIEASAMPEQMKKRLVDQILAFEQKQYEASPKSREEAILQAQKLHHAQRALIDDRIEQAIAGLTFASEAEKRDIVHALETWLKFEASKTTKLTLDEIAKQFQEIIPEYPYVLGETGFFHPGDDRSYFILNEFGTNLRFKDKENYRLLEKDYALIEAIRINQTHARPAQLPQPDPDVFVSFIIGFAEGVGSVVNDVVDLAVNIYEDPIGTLERAKDGVVQIVINAYDEVNKLIDDPQKYLIEKWGSIQRAYEEFSKLSPEEKSKFIGNLAGHAVTYAIPVGGEIKVVVKGAVEAAQIGRAVKKIESVFEKFKNSPAGQLLADERGSINFHSPEKGKPPHTERLPENKNALNSGGRGNLEVREVIAPSSGKPIKVYTDGNTIIPIDKIEKYMRGKVNVNIEEVTKELRELKQFRQTQRKVFDADPQNSQRIVQLEKMKHNYERSDDMRHKLESIGLGDTIENNQVIAKHLLDVGKEIAPENRKDFPSVLEGPNGKVKVLSTWSIVEGQPYLSTIKLIPIKN